MPCLPWLKFYYYELEMIVIYDDCDDVKRSRKNKKLNVSLYSFACVIAQKPLNNTYYKFIIRQGYADHYLWI